MTSAAPTRPTTLVDRLRDRLSVVVRELAKFGVVGACAFVVDVGLFNLLRFAGGEGPLYDKPLTAKVISAVAATAVAYTGNRFWTFRHRQKTGYAREYFLFFVFNAIGLGVAVGCLAFSHYVLGLTGPLADNIAANVVGLGLATSFRFFAYRRWVFPAYPQDDELNAELRQPV